MMFVVVAPCAVTVASVSVADPTGQFVPFVRHTACPFTMIELANRFVPLAVANPSQEVDVPFVNVSALIVPFVA